MSRFVFATMAASKIAIDQLTEVPDEVETAFDEFFVPHVLGNDVTRPQARPVVNMPKSGGPKPGDWNMLKNGVNDGKQPKHAQGKRVIYVDAMNLADPKKTDNGIYDWIAADDGKYEMDATAKAALTNAGDASDVVTYKRQDGTNDKHLYVIHAAPVQGDSEKEWGSKAEFGLQGQIANFNAYKGALKAFAETSEHRDAMVVPMLGCQEWNKPEWYESDLSNYAGAHTGPHWIRETGALLLAYMALPEHLQKKLVDDEKTVEFWANGQDSACFAPMQPLLDDKAGWSTRATSNNPETNPDTPNSRWSVMRAAMRLAQDMNMDITKMAGAAKDDEKKVDEEDKKKEKDDEDKNKKDDKKKEAPQDTGMSGLQIFLIVFGVLLAITLVIVSILCFCKSDPAVDSDF